MVRPNTTATKSYVLEPNYTQFSSIIFDGVKYECLRVPPNEKLKIWFNESVFYKTRTRVKVTRNLVLRDTPCLLKTGIYLVLLYCVKIYSQG